MRGATQAELMEADDSKFYVVKFKENPLSARVLVNEWLGAAVLDYLGVSVPAMEAVKIRGEFLRDSLDARLRLPGQVLHPGEGWHLGSRYPGHPDRTPVFDFLPDSLLCRVVNKADFLSTLVADKWAGNIDTRQCVFVRAKAPEPLRPCFLSVMIDHGYWFNGPHWTFATDYAPKCGLYFRRSVYDSLSSLDDFEPALHLLRTMPYEVLGRAVRTMPTEWLPNSDALSRLLATLMRRRKKVADLLIQYTK
jgi:hypothetical protein